MRSDSARGGIVVEESFLFRVIHYARGGESRLIKPLAYIARRHFLPPIDDALR
jgi:hypothetical protein